MSKHDGNITVARRDGQGKGAARKLRAEGKIPGVLYGQGRDNLNIKLSPRDFVAAMDQQLKLNTCFTLHLEGEDATQDVIVSDYQMHPTRDELLHIDFLRVNPEVEVSTKIPVKYEGRPVGVVAGGKLRTFRRDIRVSAKPKEIPVALVVDVAPLEGGQLLRVRDVSVPGARITERGDTLLAQVDMPKAKREDPKDKA